MTIFASSPQPADEIARALMDVGPFPWVRTGNTFEVQDASVDRLVKRGIVFAIGPKRDWTMP